MDQLTLQMGNMKMGNIKSLVGDMKKNNQHWVLWQGDEAPLFLLKEKCAPFDEVVLELYWKTGYASDIHEIRHRDGCGRWWKRTNHKYIKINGTTVGEVLCLFND